MHLRRLPWVLGLAALGWGCAEGFAPGQPVNLAIVPVLSGAMPGVLSGDLDVLRIRIARVPSGALVIDTTVAVDTAGSVDLPLTVPLLSDPEQFEVLLEGIRSADAAVLYAGVDTVSVSAAAATPPPVEIAVSYVGPCQATSGCSVTVGPIDASLPQGDSLLMTVVVDSSGIPVTGVPVGLINLDTTLVHVRTTRHVVARTGTAGGVARIVARIRSDEDTLRVTVAAPAGAPAFVIVTPGYAALRTTAPNRTIQLADTVKDLAGVLLPPTLATWTSRSPSVASVSTTGLVTGLTRGTAVIVASAGGAAADSILVTVGDATTAPGDMLVAALTNTATGPRAFASRRIGDRFAIDIVVDQLATADSLGSYNATFRWNSFVMQYDSATAGNYPAATLNPAADSVRFAAVDANSRSGRLVLARLWFTALNVGSDARAFQISELSGVSPNFVNYFQSSRYIIVPGSLLVRP